MECQLPARCTSPAFPWNDSYWECLSAANQLAATFQGQQRRTQSLLQYQGSLNPSTSVVQSRPRSRRVGGDCGEPQKATAVSCIRHHNPNEGQCCLNVRETPTGGANGGPVSSR